jgi:2-methylcitrate dehydratase PrpD
VTVRTKDGATRVKEVIYPLGHFKHPLSDAQVVAKFHEMTAARLTSTQRDDVLDTLWHLDKATDVADVIQKLCP